MSSKADWMVVAGFLLAAFGVTLRIIMMMRSSDARAANVPSTGRDLLRSYGATFPKSRLPMAMWAALTIGFVLLISGFLLEMR